MNRALLLREFFLHLFPLLESSQLTRLIGFDGGLQLLFYLLSLSDEVKASSPRLIGQPLLERPAPFLQLPLGANFKFLEGNGVSQNDESSGEGIPN